MVRFEDYSKPEVIDGVQLGCTVEVINGKEYERTDYELPHQVVRKNILLIFARILDHKSKGEVVAGLGIRFDENNFLIPDLSGFFSGSRLLTHDEECAPDFVVEILSPASRKNDLTIKKDAYAKFGIVEYWIVDPRAKTVDVYTLNPVTLKLELEACYHHFDEEIDWSHKSKQEQAEIKSVIKSQMANDVEIEIKEIFEAD